MIEKALSAGEDYKAADYIEQAAKEMGGVYTGRAASAIIPEAGPPVDENKPRRLHVGARSHVVASGTVFNA
jgi:hypothetical protein